MNEGLSRMGRTRLDELLGEEIRDRRTLCSRLLRMASTEPEKRHAAVGYLGLLKCRKAVPVLVDLIGQASDLAPRERESIISDCCDAIGRIDTAEGHRELRRLLDESEDSFTRCMAIDAMGYEFNSAEHDRIIAAVRGRGNARFRMHAMWAVYEQVGGGNASLYKDLVVESVDDRSPGVRRIAIDALISLGPDYRDLVLERVRDRGKCAYNTTRVSKHALDALKEIDHRASMGFYP